MALPTEQQTHVGSYHKILSITDRILNGGEITKEEAIELIHTPDEDTMILLAMADKIKQHFNDNSVDICAIVNARSGKCPENCKFCAQSAHHNTGVQEYPFMDDDSLLEAAKKAKEAGAIRFSIVTSGRNTSNPNEFNQILRVLKQIREEVGLEICCSLGLLTYEQALQLKEVGVTRYHSNIETAPSHFPDICTTHSYEDKMFTIDNAKKAGIRVCSGGILGLNETLEQRVEMAFELKRLNIDSIPLNILNPIKGTPFEDNKALKPMEILRTFAVFRFILPKALIRTAGGREVNLRDLQSYALKGGLNGIMVGGYLTTGGRSPQDDLQMIDDLELTRTAVQL
ncbi:biotin synthase BioB [Veillonella tobetsuensis]|jgi:biotin synthase